MAFRQRQNAIKVFSQRRRQRFALPCTAWRLRAQENGAFGKDKRGVLDEY